MTSRCRSIRALLVSAALLSPVGTSGCRAKVDDTPGAGTPASAGTSASAPAERRPPRSPNRIVRLLEAGEPVLGVFSGEHTAAQGAAMATNRETDFVFFSLEEPPFDIASFQAYRGGMAGATHARHPRPLALRIPALRDGRTEAEAHARQALEAGADAIVFPHVGSADEARAAVRAMGAESWPSDPLGRHVAMFIVEDRAGVEHVREIVGTPGVGVVFAGPGDLRRAYDGNGDAVEGAIQSVLSACKEFGVPCGITAGVKDIAMRLHEGFRVIIVLQPEALAVGLEASGRL